MKSLLIISFSNLSSDPRVNRQIRFLKKNYKIIALGLESPNLEQVQYLPIIVSYGNWFQKIKSALKLLCKQYESYYWNQPHIIDCCNKLSHLKADLIIANDIDSLPLALKAANSAKVIFDAHEYAPKEFEDRLSFKLFFQKYKTYLCNTYIPRVNGMMTVCQGIANTYEKDTGVKPVVITNAPNYENIQPQLLNDTNDKISLIHHGGAIKSRKIENMIEMMDYLDERFELNFMLVEASSEYLHQLKKLAANKKNIHFLTPVPMLEISRYTNQFDVGVFLLEPTNFNYFYALPNKFFEFIQARLAVAIAPSPEMAKIVKEYDCGIVADNFKPESLAKALMKLDRQKINYYKQQSHKIAKLFSAEQNQQRLLNLVAEVLAK
jgi:glycosyltransferase involved in cell wall biosynthesis